MRVLVHGYGSVGRRHVATALLLGHQVYVHDPDLARCRGAVAAGANLATDDLRILAYERLAVDAVVIATPVADHAEAFWRETVRQVPVFVEKPLAESREAYARAAIADPTLQTRVGDARVQVGYNWRFHPDVLRFLSEHPRPDRVELECRTRMSDWPGRGYGDPLLECSHEVDLLAFWRGRMPALTGAEADGTDGCRLLFGADTVTLSWSTEPRRMLTAHYADGRRDVLRPGLGPSLDVSYRDSLAWFLARAADVSPVHPACDLAGGLAVLRVVEQARAMLGREP